MNLIVAIDKNNAIGKDDELLFRISKDLKNFKEVTTGKVVILGKKTLETFPNKKPLKNRINLVLTHSEDPIEGAIIENSIDEVLNDIKYLKDEDVFVIGGESIYKQFLPYCKTLYITEIKEEIKDANKFFPEFKKDFYEVSRIENEENGIKFDFVIYKRRA